MKSTKIALQLVEESLKELDSSKGSVVSAIQKLQRAADIIDDSSVKLWCSIQLGNTQYTKPLRRLIDFLIENKGKTTKEYQRKQDKYNKELEELGLNHHDHFSNEEINIKADESGGGYSNIGFIEEKYADFVRNKSGNDGTYYKTNLNRHINYVKTKAHDLSSKLFSQLKFTGTVSNCFEVLKSEIDDRLLDLNPVLAEQLMLAFKAVSSTNEEELSHALTSCRRLLEGLADEVYPATEESVNGRLLEQANYINRLWAFMDSAIESETNKSLAKAHVDFLGSWISTVNQLANKGVHGELGQLEAIKALFHTYLVIADILDYLNMDKTSSKKLDINDASIDQIEALLGVKRTIAKEIFKYKIKEGYIDLQSLSAISGVGPKTLQKAKDEFEIE